MQSLKGTIECGHARSSCWPRGMLLGAAGCLAASLGSAASAQAAPQAERADVCAEVCGAYEVAPGWLLAMSSEGKDLVYQDFESGRVGLLHESREGVFTAGPTLMSATPVASTFRVVLNAENRPTALVVEEAGRPARTASRLSFRQADIEIRNGEVVLAAVLISPDSERPHPGLVIIPGGGPQKRDLVQSWWRAYHGFSVLTYDKRGTGSSTGEYKQAAILDLADDAAAAVNALSASPNVDKGRIGIIGHSEAGFVAPIVTSRSSQIAFAIVLSPSTAPMPQQILHEVETSMRCEGSSGEEIAKAKALRNSLNESVLENGSWPQLRRDIEAAEQEKWFRSARVSPEWKEHSAVMLERDRRYLDFDPTKFWRRVKTPVLAVFGEVDTQVSTGEESQRILRNALEEAQNRDYAIRFFPKANHIFLEVSSGCPDEFPQLSRFVPGYFDTLVTWAFRQIR